MPQGAVLPLFCSAQYTGQVYFKTTMGACDTQLNTSSITTRSSSICATGEEVGRLPLLIPAGPRFSHPWVDQQTLLYAPMGPLPALGAGGRSGPSLPPIRPGKIYPNIIPSPLGEKPNCTTDPLKKTGRQRVKERRGGQADYGGNCPRGG